MLCAGKKAILVNSVQEEISSFFINKHLPYQLAMLLVPSTLICSLMT